MPSRKAGDGAIELGDEAGGPAQAVLIILDGAEGRGAAAEERSAKLVWKPKNDRSA
jgi:hypothetical protein